MAHRPARRCSECGKSLEGLAASAKTDSPKCRSARSRRIGRIKKQNAETAHLDPEQRELRSIVENELEDQAKEVAREELRPVVREAMTEDVMRSIQSLVSLTPRVVEAISEDLDAEDPNVRQRAYSLIARYLFGKDTLVAPQDGSPSGLVVNFQLPRPGDEATVDSETTGPDAIIDANEVRTCDLCEQEKPVSEFVSGSDRCQTCFDNLQAKTAELLDKQDDSDRLRLPASSGP